MKYDLKYVKKECVYIIHIPIKKIKPVRLKRYSITIDKDYL